VRSARLTVELDGRTTVVEVADDLATVRVGERSYPVRVVRAGPNRVELEIGGETVVVDGWPEGQSSPPGPVDVNGARLPASVRLDAGPREPRAPGAPGLPPAPPAAPPAPPSGAGVPVVPPMPGRVLEVRVREGEAVAKGTVLLVLEAMKMRNEVTAPVDGVVRELRVREGASVRARETMLVLVPPPDRSG
jgi:glutaconyl-CoA/methylmalonyl-CoA decarboxylase subunit gamma